MFHNVYLGTSPDLTAADLVASRLPMALYYHVPGLTPGATYYWRVDEIEKDLVTLHTGDVWSFVAQAKTAYLPDPADGSNTASTTPTLTWLPGLGAVKHHLYFGDSLAAVTQGTAAVDKGILTEATFAPGILDSLTTYYWRVDEVLGGDAVTPGVVWKFTTAVTVDDFESYTDAEGGRIYETWIDGFTNNTGSIVGNAQAPFAEQVVVHSGLQSMPLDYNNVATPFYSDAELEFAPVQNWTANGTDTLVLHVRGRVVNSAAPLYVALEDSSAKIGVVVHPDAAILTTTKWVEWKVPLSGFTGVNATKVKKLHIGVGNRTTPAQDGTGRLYLDDIRLAKP